MDDAARVEAVINTGLLDTEAEERFDRLTRLARRALGADVALVSLVDKDRQWFKSKDGTALCETGRDIAFCDHAIRTPDDIMVVHDTNLDDRFSKNPLVTGDPHIGFYAGAPLVTKDGHAIGTLCVLDSKPRADFNNDDQQTLRDLAASVMVEVELHERNQQIDDMEVVVQELKHRMGNMYAHVSSMVTLMGKNEDDKQQLVRRLRSQIANFGQTQKLLAANEYQSAELKDVFSAVLEPFETLDDDARFTITHEAPQRVSSRGVFLVTLVLGELSTNAVKHGALGSQGGSVTIATRTTPEGQFELSWSEHVEKNVTAEDAPREGFGSRILTDIGPRGLGGSAELGFNDNGITYTLTANPAIIFASGEAE